MGGQLWSLVARGASVLTAGGTALRTVTDAFWTEHMLLHRAAGRTLSAGAEGGVRPGEAGWDQRSAQATKLLAPLAT